MTTSKEDMTKILGGETSNSTEENQTNSIEITIKEKEKNPVFTGKNLSGIKPNLSSENSNILTFFFKHNYRLH